MPFQGTTRILLTKIPFYKEVVLMSFSCDDCGYQNNELQSGGEIQEKGIRIKLVVNTVADLNRTVVKSEHTIINVPAIEFEVKSTKGGTVINIFYF